ncbi:MAG: sulfatase [Planctomycetota bacterium]|nr:sulfatase [Planctomycetota bacterium]
MRILYFDVDTTRADHLSCYGYRRQTTPNMDRIAAQGVRFDNCYVSDAPCLPSRASMFTGQFGIRTGIVGHGGTAADPRCMGAARGFSTMNQRPGFIWSLRQQGYYPVSVSPFAERHAAWWFYEGWREMYNTGKSGNESAEEVVPVALDWLARHGKQDNWLLHINVWDPHTPYRAPAEFGNPFEHEPLDPWYTEALRQKQWQSWGAGSPREPAGALGARYRAGPRQPLEVASMDDYKRWVDGYDCGLRYTDMWFGRVLDALANLGVLEDTAIIVTSDHGETLGELAVIGDHQTADHITSRVPMIIRWPGQKDAGRVDRALHYQTDIAATIIELAGGKVPGHWDGRGFGAAFRTGTEEGREFLVVSQCAWSCQRSVRWAEWLSMRTFHTGLKKYPARMLYNVAEDPHLTRDLATSRPDLVLQGDRKLEEWTTAMLAGGAEDPLHTVMSEGGPYHTRGAHTEKYIQRLRDTGRGAAADFLQAHPTGLGEWIG